MEQDQQEIFFKLSMFEQQIQQLQQQIQAVEQGFVDLRTLKEDLNEIKGKEGKEIMAMIGRGIFVKAKLISEDLVVDIGSKNFVKKSIPETRKLIEEQIEKLKEAKQSLNDSIDEISEEAQKLVEQFKKDSDEKN